ncbi:hypothetical protein YC2023_050513 [Brassica napus]
MGHLRPLTRPAGSIPSYSHSSTLNSGVLNRCVTKKIVSNFHMYLYLLLRAGSNSWQHGQLPWLAFKTRKLSVLLYKNTNPAVRNSISVFCHVNRQLGVLLSRKRKRNIKKLKTVKVRITNYFKEETKSPAEVGEVLGKKAQCCSERKDKYGI